MQVYSESTLLNHYYSITSLVISLFLYGCFFFGPHSLITGESWNLLKHKLYTLSFKKCPVVSFSTHTRKTLNSGHCFGEVRVSSMWEWRGDRVCHKLMLNKSIKNPAFEGPVVTFSLCERLPKTREFLCLELDEFSFFIKLNRQPSSLCCRQYCQKKMSLHHLSHHLLLHILFP